MMLTALGLAARRLPNHIVRPGENTMTRSHRMRRLAAFAALTLLATGSAHAQTESKDRILEEIIVTVDRREQNLQDVAALAQAFTEDDLQLAGVGNELRNLATLVPGMNIANQEGNIE